LLRLLLPLNFTIWGNSNVGAEAAPNSLLLIEPFYR